MITDKQFEAGLERIENNEAFNLRHPVLGRITLARDGRWIQMDLRDIGASFWCQYVDLTLDTLMLWMEADVIGAIGAKYLEVDE